MRKCSSGRSDSSLLLLFVAVITLIVSAHAVFADPAYFSLFTRFPLPIVQIGSTDIMEPGWAGGAKITDINGDGRADLVVQTSYHMGNMDSLRLYVYLQNESGALNTPMAYPTGNGSSFDIADLNGDGRPDIVVTTYEGVGILYQNASGGFDPMVTYSFHPWDGGFDKVRIADLNHDGLPDIIKIVHFTNADYTTYTAFCILFQNKDHTFGPPVIIPCPVGDYAMGDVNNDGRTDIVATTATTEIKIFLQTPEGTFQETTYDCGLLAQSVDVGDINGDGLLDIAITYTPDGTVEQGAAILYQNATGGFGPPVILPHVDNTTYSSTIKIADINQDGKADILVLEGFFIDYVSPGTQYMLVQFTQGADGQFSADETTLTFCGASAGWFDKLAVGDINGDGAYDLVVAGDNEGSVVLYNRGLGARISCPSSIDFGQTITSSLASQTFTIVNMGSRSLTVNGLALAGQNASDFYVSNNSCAGQELTFLARCDVTVVFHPSFLGDKTASLSVSSNDPSTPSLQMALKGQAVAAQQPIAPPVFWFAKYPVVPNGTAPVLLPSNPESAVAIGDVNGDGRNDVVMTNSYLTGENYSQPWYFLSIFLQNDMGRLDEPLIYSVEDFILAVKIGDLNNDGRKDIVVNAGTGIGVFYQDATGHLGPMVRYTCPGSAAPEWIELGDFNHDGLLDVAAKAGNMIYIYTQNTDGTLSCSGEYSSVSDGFDSMAVGDVNHDGLDDVISVNGGLQGSSWLYNSIGIFYQSPGNLLNSLSYLDALAYDDTSREYYYLPTHGVAVGDINGDGLNDLVVGLWGDYPFDGRLAVFPQNTSGKFDPIITYVSEPTPSSVAIGDLNNDGRQDVAVLHYNCYGVGIYLQGSDGRLLDEQLLPPTGNSNISTHALAIGDLNGDGRNDIAVAWAYGSKMNLVVFYNGEADPADTSPRELFIMTKGNGEGTVQYSPSPLSPDLQYPPGTVVTLTAIPGDSSYFTGWSDPGCPGTGKCILKMTYDRGVTAFFALKTPVITSITPFFTTSGVSVRIAGWNFGDDRLGYTVAFNGQANQECDLTSSSEISCQVPAGLTSASITVTTGGGTSSPAMMTLNAPSIIRISPQSGPVGAVVTITGKHFSPSQGSSIVSFNGVHGIVTFWKDMMITCTVPLGAGSGPVSVTTPVGTSNTVRFILKRPVITYLSRTSGKEGTKVTIRGNYFGPSQDQSTVSFNGLPAPVSFWSNTKITCTVPAGATTGPLLITTPAGTSGRIRFTVRR